jgi:hypothetical protein
MYKKEPHHQYKAFYKLKEELWSNKQVRRLCYGPSTYIHLQKGVVSSDLQNTNMMLTSQNLSQTSHTIFYSSTNTTHSKHIIAGALFEDS